MTDMKGATQERSGGKLVFKSTHHAMHAGPAAAAYGKRSLVETAIGRYKSLIGCRLRARSIGAQQIEVAVGCAILNRMFACPRPKSVRGKKATA